MLLVEGALGLGMRLDVLGEPFLELVVGVEEFGHDEVEEGPEFGHGVLDGGSGEEQAVSGIET